MEHESYPHLTDLTGIHINLGEQAIEFEDRHGTVGRLRFGGTTVIYEGTPLLLAPAAPAPTSDPDHAPLSAEPAPTILPAIDR